MRLLIWAPLAALACMLLAVAIVLAAGPARPADPAARRHRRRGRQPGARGDPQPTAAVGGRMVDAARDLPGDTGRVLGAASGPARVWCPRTEGASRGLPAGSTIRESLTVVSLSGDGRGLAIGPQLAAFASSLGIITRLVPTVGHVRAPHLWAACAVDQRRRQSGRACSSATTPRREKVDLTIFLVVVERMHPYLGDTPASDGHHARPSAPPRRPSRSSPASPSRWTTPVGASTGSWSPTLTRPTAPPGGTPWRSDLASSPYRRGLTGIASARGAGRRLGTEAGHEHRTLEPRRRDSRTMTSRRTDRCPPW